MEEVRSISKPKFLPEGGWVDMKIPGETGKERREKNNKKRSSRNGMSCH
jgi:hypothetical protein